MKNLRAYSTLTQQDLQPLKSFPKLLYNTAAYLCIALGVVGIFLPLIPTTPFLLLAMLLLTRSNPKIAAWLNNNRYLGSYIRSYTKREKLPAWSKVKMILLVWVSIVLSIIYLTENLYVRLFLGLLAVILTIHIVLLRTKNHNSDSKVKYQHDK